MKKITIILILMFAVVSFSGYRAIAVEDLVDDFVVTQVETDTCPMHGDGTRLQPRDGSGYGQRNGVGMGRGMGRMMNRGYRRNPQGYNNNQTPFEDCPHFNTTQELK
ncbi:MAG: hypothetical protein KGZ51_00045 [Erysipelothrix sp.]|nr:hypothetical protein [Erysipelothrix sp.]